MILTVMLSRTMCSRTRTRLRTWNPRTRTRTYKNSKDTDEDLRPNLRPRLKKLKVKTNYISKVLPQRHITVNCDDFSKMLHILNVISSIVLPE